MTSAPSARAGTCDPPPELRPASGRQELLTLSGGDPYLRWSVSEAQADAALIGPNTVAIERIRHHDRRSLVIVPLPGHTAADVDVTLAAVAEVVTGRGLNGISVPQAYGDLLASRYPIGTGGNWDWMWTTAFPQGAPPPRPEGDRRVVRLDDSADAAELSTFAHANNPRVWTEIGTGKVDLWLGIRGADGELEAIGGAELEDSGVPHLAGIVTDSRYRNTGLGTLVSAALTQWALTHHGVCTLGMFSDNGPARTLYRRLGYRTAHAWFSRRLLTD